MQEVIEVPVRDRVARLRPVEERLPASRNQVIGAAEEVVSLPWYVEEPVRVASLAPSTHAYPPRIVGRSDGTERAVDEVDVVLLRNGAAVGLPGAVADDGGVEL